MATVAAPSSVDQRFLLTDVSWDFYEHLLDELGDRRVRVTFDRGALELMAPTYRHENYARTLGKLVGVLCEELNLPVKDGGSTTFRREDLERGLEPDDCFYIHNVRKILGKDEIDLTIDPPPDLAIEIDVTRSSLDRMGIYAALRVPEVWRFDGQTLQVWCLRPDGEYEERERSPTFPALALRRVVEFLGQAIELDDVALIRKFRAWVRKQVVPRRKGNARK
jgi:Uma2 family endonuclease